jgi:hypothetical protein
MIMTILGGQRVLSFFYKGKILHNPIFDVLFLVSTAHVHLVFFKNAKSQKS